mmetsp:Transcript_8576/g.37818  ORF Transcript_8576/g.37818 Transcript_8576/m.37818 type:complete len:296 (-) Transcript_8576:272-1159(-)
MDLKPPAASLTTESWWSLVSRRHAISSLFLILTFVLLAPLFFHIAEPRMVDRELEETPEAMPPETAPKEQFAPKILVESDPVKEFKLAKPTVATTPFETPAPPHHSWPPASIAPAPIEEKSRLLGTAHNRFTDSGIAFPMCCSMQQALEGLAGSTSPVSKGREYLLNIDFTKCDTHPSELDSVFAQMFVVVPPTNTFDRCGGMQCKITFGKYMNKASEDLETYVRKAEAHEPPPRAIKVTPKSERWGRKLCAPPTTRGTACSAARTLRGTPQRQGRVGRRARRSTCTGLTQPAPS